MVKIKWVDSLEIASTPFSFCARPRHPHTSAFKTFPMPCIWHLGIFHTLTKLTAMSCTNVSFRASTSFPISSLMGQFFGEKESPTHQRVLRVCFSLYRIIEFGIHFPQNIICSETWKINSPLKGQLYTPTPRGSPVTWQPSSNTHPSPATPSQPSVSFPHRWSVACREQWRYFKCYLKADPLTMAWWLHQKLSVRTVPKASSSNCCLLNISLKRI